MPKNQIFLLFHAQDFCFFLQTGKTPEEIRKTFQHKNDVTPEEEEQVSFLFFVFNVVLLPGPCPKQWSTGLNGGKGYRNRGNWHLSCGLKQCCPCKSGLWVKQFLLIYNNTGKLENIVR